MKFISGLLLGLGVGVAIGFLFAPQSGEATREQLNVQGVQLRTGAFSEGVRARANEIVARANDAWTQGIDRYARTKEELTERYTKARTGELS